MDREAFRQFADLEQRHWWFRGRRGCYVPLLEHVLARDLGRAPRDLLVVDVGCGVGGFLAPLQRFGRVLGLELDEPSIAYCRERGHRETLVARSDALPLPPSSVDLLTLWDVLEHTPDDRVVLRELLATLRPGGHLALSLPAYPWLYANNDRVAHHFRRYTRGEIVGKLREAGFAVRKATYVNVALAPLIVPTVLAIKTVEDVFRIEAGGRTNLSVSPPAPLNAALAAIFSGEQRLLRHVSSPFGHSLFCVARRPASS
ncbi:MAG: class I SAM-dependent methyltransferase [Planctomycetes bacterium]|nr:class I SAM-dependent methyltransferase [Planctomycetota bacterium]